MQLWFYNILENHFQAVLLKRGWWGTIVFYMNYWEVMCSAKILIIRQLLILRWDCFCPP